MTSRAPSRWRGSAGPPSVPECVRGGRAFTLVELLVVLAIVGLLAGLLLPALGRSKASAQRLRCTGNLRQLGLAAQMYWDDHAGATFRYRGAATNGGDVFWFGWLARGSEGERAFDPRAGALAPYLAGRGVEVCPALDYRRADFKLKARGAAWGYGYNLHLSAPAAEPPIRVPSLDRPSELALFADAAQVNTFQPPASPTHPRLEEFYFVSSGETTAHFRHAGVANVAFCDGHVADERPVPGSLDVRMPRDAVARLRPAILVRP